MFNVSPILIPLVIFMIPIIAILTSHQRKMAELYVQQARTQGDPEIAALRQEMQELKSLIHQQAIAIDSLAGRTATPPTANVPERLQTGGY
jgi:hypothetical protein